MQATTVREALRASLTGALGTFLSAIPRIIAFAIVLVVGWLIASLVAGGTIALLRAVRFNDLARRSGLAGFVQNMGVRQDATGVIAGVVKWFVRLMTLVVAFDTLGLPAVSGVLQQLLLWLPNLIVGLVALVIGGLAANALSRLVRGSAAGAGLQPRRAGGRHQDRGVGVRCSRRREPARHRDHADQHAARRRGGGGRAGCRPRVRSGRPRPGGTAPRPARPAGRADGPEAGAGRAFGARAGASRRGSVPGRGVRRELDPTLGERPAPRVQAGHWPARGGRPGRETSRATGPIRSACRAADDGAQPEGGAAVGASRAERGML